MYNMIEFREIQLSDRAWIEERLKKSDFKSCDYSFVNNYIWRKSNQIKIADYMGFYCVKSVHKNVVVYTYPSGEGDIKALIEELLSDARRNNHKFILRGILPENKIKIEELFPGKFVFENPRDEADYIYESEKLIYLKGKKLHGKRNHIARFKDNPNWLYEKITDENMEECLKMNDEWCKEYSCVNNDDLNHELCAVKEMFAHYAKLKVVGGLLRVDGKVVAYSVGEPLSSDTFGVHIEKAFPKIQGAYPMINQQFAEHNAKDFKYINREEDMGDEGLRKAKLSYKPDILLEKYIARLSEECEPDEKLSGYTI